MSAPATSLSTAARRFQVGMHVDRAWRDHPEVTAAQYAVLVAATSKGQGRAVTARLATIAAALGRRRERATDQVSAALAHLEELGAVERSRTRRGTGVTRLKIHRAAGGYDVIPWELMRAVEARNVQPGVLRTWAHLSETLGAYGWTHDTNAEIAAAAHVTSRTLLKHLAQLEGIGLIARTEGRRRAIVRAGATYSPASETPPVHSTRTPVADTARGGVADTGSTPVADTGSIELAPEDSLAPDISPSSRSDRHLSEREAHATSGRKRPSRGGIYQVEGINDVAELLRTDPAWRHGIRSQWLNGILAQVVRPALDHGLAAEAIAHALLTDAEILEMAELEQPLVRAAQAAITALRIDIRDHERCRDCGRSRNELDGTDLIERRCGWCHEQHHPDTGHISDEVLQEVYARLGADREDPTNQPVAVVGAVDTDPENHTTEEKTMTATVGPQTRLTRDVLEAARPDELAELREARLEQVERLRRATTQRPRVTSSPEDDRRAKKSRDAQRRKLRLLEGTWADSRAMVDATSARRRLWQLHAQGYSAAVLAVLTGTDPSHLRRLMKDPDSGRGHRWVARDHERRILEAEFDLDLVPGASRVPAWSTRRRVQALVAIGWSLGQLGARAGVSRASVHDSIQRDEVSAATARRYRDLYTELENTPGPSQRSRTEAYRKGWPPPAAWDDIDDFAEEPDPSRWVKETDLGSSRRRIHLEDLEDLASWGFDIRGAAERLSVTVSAVDVCARRAERLDVLERLRANGVEHSVA